MNLLDKLLKKNKKTEEQSAAGTGNGTAATSGSSLPTTSAAPSNGGKAFVEGLVSTKDIIAPSAIELDFDFMRIDNRYYRTIFVTGYPRFVGINWLSSLINFDASLTTSMYIYPTDGKEILDDLRRKIAEMEAEISTDIQRGRVVNPATQAKLEDALNLQADLVKGEERFFQFGLYVTISADTKEEVNRINKNLEAALGSLMIISKKATLQMEEGFTTTLPICSDRLNITRNMDTTSLATTFPFVSSDLSDDKGVMYGINEHNGSLVIFDRFSMPNYNSVVFATAGAGKSYLIKLEALRSLMLGAEIIVIDPENEYKDLAEAVGGQYVAFGYNEVSKINPFDLSLVTDDEENALSAKILNLHKMFKIMLGDMDAIEESILDRAVMDAYRMKGITPDPETQTKEPPLIEDLYKALIGMEEEKARGLAARLEKYIKGSFAGIFNQKTTVNLSNKFVVFGIRNLEDALRPVAMHIILDYIWTVVKKTLKKRLIIVDEAWYLMQYPDSAAFLRGIVKRGRKYYLGVTTITQDVDDFLSTPYGKEIVTNSSIQILLKQHSAAIDKIGEVFYLSEGEKQLLLSADKGEGIFFAGQNHVAIRIIASEEEHKLITSNPEEILKMKQAGKVPDKSTMAAAAAEASQASQAETITAPINLTTTTPLPSSANGPLMQEAPAATVKEVEKTPGLVEVETVKEETNGAKTAETSETVEEKQNKSPLETVVVEPPALSQNTSSGDNQAASSTEDVLKRRIQEMEEEEKKVIEEHQKKMEEERKKEEEQKRKEEEEKQKLFGGGLPKYQELFKAFDTKIPSGDKLPPLPPLPPLPKTEAAQKSPFAEIKPETNSDGNKKVGNKPIFVNPMPPEPKIPQPPQLAKKPKLDFVKAEENQAATTGKPETKKPEPGPSEKSGEAPKESIGKKEPQVPQNKPKDETNIPKNEPKAAPNKTEENKTSEPVKAASDQSASPGKLSYEDLFGNGIV